MRVVVAIAAIALSLAYDSGPNAHADTNQDGQIRGPVELASGSCDNGGCPLRTWMRNEIAPAMDSEDLAALEQHLEKLAEMAPPNYSRWAPLARRGAKAAAAGDLQGVKDTCTSCHSAFRRSYRREHRARKIPTGTP